MIKYVVLFLLILTSVSCNSSKFLFQADSPSWSSEGDASWTFENDELTGNIQNGAGFVVTKESFKDFILELEFNPDSTINSGIFVRCQNEKITPDDCFEINIWDLHPNQDFRTGSIVKKFKPLANVETIGKWNTYKIRCLNDRTQVWINGTLTADLTDKSLAEGRICLQASGKGEISFRNVKIKSI